jgi:signal transduction histidine kinase
MPIASRDLAETISRKIEPNLGSGRSLSPRVSLNWSTVTKLVAAGKVEFVGRHGDFASLAASLMLQHRRAAEVAQASNGLPWTTMSEDVAEVFRHDINNPLTGILGNAELVLSHAVKLPPADIQKLQTVVELAVRLRETIRRLSDEWEAKSRSLESA